MIGSNGDYESFANYLYTIDFKEVQTDLEAFFLESSETWPSDYENYAPFFVRLAWHCTGSYRHSDGRGGCDGQFNCDSCLCQIYILQYDFSSFILF